MTYWCITDRLEQPTKQVQELSIQYMEIYNEYIVTGIQCQGQ